MQSPINPEAFPLHEGTADLVFDMDGLLIDSLPHLANAMTDTVCKILEVPSLIEKFERFDFANPGMTRFEKIEKALDLAGKIGEERSWARAQSLETFDALARAARLEAELDHDIFRFAELDSRYFRLSILSNCDNGMLPDVVNHKKMGSLFGNRVYGTPPSKVTTLQRLVDENSGRSSNVVFVSDSESDFDVAQNCGTKFVFIRRFSRSLELPPQMLETSYDTLGDFFLSLSRT